MEIPELSRVDRVAGTAVSVPVVNQLSQHRDVVKAVQALNKAEMFGAGYELSFSLDGRTQEAIIRIVDKTTRQAIAQVLPPHVLSLLEQLPSAAADDTTGMQPTSA